MNFLCSINDNLDRYYEDCGPSISRNLLNFVVVTHTSDSEQSVRPIGVATSEIMGIIQDMEVESEEILKTKNPMRITWLSGYHFE